MKGSEPDERESASHTRRALLMMLLATCCFVGMTALVKTLRENGLETSEVVFWRSAPGLIWVALELRIRQTSVRPKIAGPIIMRSLAGLVAMLSYFYALRALTMIESTVLHLLQPVFIAVMAPVLVEERLRQGAIVALVLALVGALVVLRPDRAWAADLPWLAVFAGLLAAVASAYAHIMVRRATAHDAPELVVFWFTVTMSLAGLGMSLANGRMLSGLPVGLELPEAAWKIALMAGLGLAGQLFMTRAYERAAAPVVAIVAYASIPASVLFDQLAWGVAPGLEVALGSVLMVVAGALLLRAPATD